MRVLTLCVAAIVVFSGGLWGQDPPTAKPVETETTAADESPKSGSRIWECAEATASNIAAATNDVAMRVNRRERRYRLMGDAPGLRDALRHDDAPRYDGGRDDRTAGANSRNDTAGAKGTGLTRSYLTGRSLL